MADRDRVRELAWDIRAIHNTGPEGDLEQTESRIRAFLAELGEQVQAERDRAALEAIENQADEDRARAELIQEQRARRRAMSDRDRAMGEVAGLREAVTQTWAYHKVPQEVRDMAQKALAASPLSKVAGEVFALVQEAAGFECEYGVPCCEEAGGPTANCWPCRARLALGALRAELDREGGRGG